MLNITKEEIQNIYDYSTSKMDIARKLLINTNQNWVKIDEDILDYFSEIGIDSRNQISRKELSKHWLGIKKRDYDLNPKYCLLCGKKIPFEKRDLKFCNQSCANSHSNKNRGKRSEETKLKISRSLNESFAKGLRVAHNQYTGPNSNQYYSKLKNQSNNYISHINENINLEILNKNQFKHVNELIENGIILNIDNYIPKNLYINIYKLRKHKCLNCGREFYGRISKYGNCIYSLECCDKCRKEYNAKLSSESIKQAIANGTFLGWKSRNITSFPELFWIKVLDNNHIEYQREYLLSCKNRGNNKRYFLDFYIEINGKKIDLEIDGKLHELPDRIKSDQERDIIVKSFNIEIYCIKWNEINSDNGKLLMKEKIDKFLEYINKI